MLCRRRNARFRLEKPEHFQSEASRKIWPQVVIRHHLLIEVRAQHPQPTTQKRKLTLLLKETQEFSDAATLKIEQQLVELFSWVGDEDLLSEERARQPPQGPSFQ